MDTAEYPSLLLEKTFPSSREGVADQENERREKDGSDGAADKGSGHKLRHTAATICKQTASVGTPTTTTTVPLDERIRIRHAVLVLADEIANDARSGADGAASGGRQAPDSPNPGRVSV